MCAQQAFEMSSREASFDAPVKLETPDTEEHCKLLWLLTNFLVIRCCDTDEFHDSHHLKFFMLLGINVN